MSCVGVNIGALTIKVVAVRAEGKKSKVMAHQGRPTSEADVRSQYKWKSTSMATSAATAWPSF